jgi:hypothetical protein
VRPAHCLYLWRRLECREARSKGDGGASRGRADVTRFVVRGATSLRFRDDDIPRGPQLNFFESIRQVALVDNILSATGGQERSFVHEIRKVGSGHAGS